jgi:hypothetical protein
MTQFIKTKSGLNININNIDYIYINNNEYKNKTTYIIRRERINDMDMEIDKEDFENLKNQNLFQQFIEVVQGYDFVYYININKIIYINEHCNNEVYFKFKMHHVLLSINYDEIKKNINEKNNKFVEVVSINNNRLYIRKDEIISFESNESNGLDGSNYINIDISTTTQNLTFISIDESNLNLLLMS